MAKGKDFKKKPKVGVSPQPTKTPRIESFPDPNKQHPAWRIALLEMCDPFGWHELDRAKLDEIRVRLRELEKLTWNEILVAQKHWNHTVAISALCSAAQDRLTALHLDDVDEVVSLRLNNKERIWGFRLDGAMTLLWWDPTHDVWQD